MHARALRLRQIEAESLLNAGNPYPQHTGKNYVPFAQQDAALPP
jgi:hypothetical protein